MYGGVQTPTKGPQYGEQHQNVEQLRLDEASGKACPRFLMDDRALPLVLTLICFFAC